MAKKPPHILLIDLSNLLCRIYYRKKCSAPGDLPQYVLPAIKGAVREWDADYVILVADPVEGESFRYRLYDDYKHALSAKEEGITAKLLTQTVLPYLDEWGLEVVWDEEHEADDCIASLAKRITHSGGVVSILSGDRDLWALVRDGKVRCLYPEKGQEHVVREKSILSVLGVSASQILALKLLAGDKSDNIYRVGHWDRTKTPYGFTEKRAAELLAEYGSIRGIMQNLDALPQREREWLEHDSGGLNDKAKLIRMVDIVPLKVDMKRATVEGL